jgi:hypothetical protein
MEGVSAKILEQLNEHSIFGRIFIEFEVSHTYHGITLLYADNCDRIYESSVFCGIEYALEHSQGIKGIKVKINKIDHHEVDTNGIVILYLTIAALSKSQHFEHLKQKVFFNRDSASFSFQK